MDNAQAYGLLLLSEGAEGLPQLYQHDQRRAVSARELHQWLEIPKDFSDWVKYKIGQHRFKEGEHYQRIQASKNLLPKIGEQKKKHGGHNATEYILSLDAAKIIALGTNNEKGDRVKRKFLEYEQIALRVMAQVVPTPTVDGMLPGMEEHLSERFQRGQSQAARAFLLAHGGVNAVIQHGRTVCQIQCGLTARQIMEVGKAAGLPYPARCNAREVMRNLAPAVACSMSLADTMVVHGAPAEAANELAAGFQDLFTGMIALGLKPAETWKGPRHASMSLPRIAAY